MRPLIAAAVLALLIAAAFLAGELTGERREHRRTAADFAMLRAVIDAQQATLLSVPDTAVEHRQQIAAWNREQYRASVDRLDAYYLDLREAS